MIAKNENAEKLWKYIIAYRKHLGEIRMESNLTIEPIPLEEHITLSVEN